MRDSLQNAGRQELYVPGQVLFREDDGNIGVFVIVKGKLTMSVRGLPKLDRVFSAGSLLGLPSTFTGHAYSLSAQAVTEVDAIHVSSETFLQLMRERTDLCREATEMLGREVTFIQSALAERRKQSAKAKLEVGALV